MGPRPPNLAEAKPNTADAGSSGPWRGARSGREGHSRRAKVNIRGVGRAPAADEAKATKGQGTDKGDHDEWVKAIDKGR